MRARLGFVAAAALILLVNALVLAGVRLNRSGVESRLVLTERECALNDRGGDDEDTGRSLVLGWQTPANKWDYWSWLGPDDLRAVGFDLSIPPTDPRASRAYDHLPPRPGFLVLEMDGPAWTGWLENRARELTSRPPAGNPGVPAPEQQLADDRERESRLVAVAAGRDLAALRRRFPDRGRHLILPARIWLYHGAVTGHAPELRGRADLLIKEVHVPLHLRPVLDHLPPRVMQRGGTPQPPRYQVTLATGRRGEPWLEGIELLK
jgi:hypothetical protein